jgi:beta-glucosidase
MAAYNRLHGIYCSEHPLLVDLLKQEWAFDGVIMSDWYGTPQHRSRPRLRASIWRCRAPRSVRPHLADAVRAVKSTRRRSTTRCGACSCCSSARAALDHPDRSAEQSIDDPEDRAVARRAATESFVLLSHPWRSAADRDRAPPCEPPLWRDRPERRGRE